MTESSPQPGDNNEATHDATITQAAPDPTSPATGPDSPADAHASTAADGSPDAVAQPAVEQASGDAVRDSKGDDGESEGEGEEEEDNDDDEDEDDESDSDDEEDEEPKLKYARLTPHLGAVYRNGDATSAFLVAGDKMVRIPRQPSCPVAPFSS